MLILPWPSWMVAAGELETAGAGPIPLLSTGIAPFGFTGGEDGGGCLIRSLRVIFLQDFTRLDCFFELKGVLRKLRAFTIHVRHEARLLARNRLHEALLQLPSGRL